MYRDIRNEGKPRRGEKKVFGSLSDERKREEADRPNHRFEEGDPAVKNGLEGQGRTG